MSTSVPIGDPDKSRPARSPDTASGSGQTTTTRVQSWYWLMSGVPFLLAFIVPYSLAQSGSQHDISDDYLPSTVDATRAAALALRQTVTITGWLLVGVVVIGAIGGGLMFARARDSGNPAANTWLPASLVLATLAVVLGAISSAVTSWVIYAPPVGPGTPWGP